MVLRNPNRTVPIVPPCDDPECRCGEYRQRRLAQSIFAEEVISNNLGEPVTLNPTASDHWFQESQFWELMDSTLVPINYADGVRALASQALDNLAAALGLAGDSTPN